MKMMNLKSETADCAKCRAGLADLLLDPAAVGISLRHHVARCESCSRELDELRATMALMDAWQAPEPSAFFDTRVKARMREAPPASLWERATNWWNFSSGRSVRPALAGALALALVVGGGTYANLRTPSATTPAAPSAAVNELKILDNNAQTVQQMDQLVDGTSDSDNAPADGPAT